MFLCILFFFISLCNRPFTQCFLSMLSCHWYLNWSMWNNSKNISKRRFQGCRRETCRRASPPENVQILQQDIMGKRQSCKNWRNKIIWFVTAISPHNWCQTQILHPKRRARLFQICYKYISGGKTYLGCFLVSLPWYTMIYSWVNLVCPKIEGGYFSALSGRKFDLTTVLRSCWPLKWRRRGFITSECLKKTCYSDFIQPTISCSTLSKITKASFFMTPWSYAIPHTPF